MTEDTNTPEPGEQAENETYRLAPGAFADDAVEAGTLVVIADTEREAQNHTVAAAGETVAELNPAYPDDDNVLFCAYRNGLDKAFGEAWRVWDPSYLAFEAGGKGVPVYSFPESRLTPKPDEWDADEEGEDDE